MYFVNGSEIQKWFMYKLYFYYIQHRNRNFRSIIILAENLEHLN